MVAFKWFFEKRFHLDITLHSLEEIVDNSDIMEETVDESFFNHHTMSKKESIFLSLHDSVLTWPYLTRFWWDLLLWYSVDKSTQLAVWGFGLVYLWTSFPRLWVVIFRSCNRNSNVKSAVHLEEFRGSRKKNDRRCIWREKKYVELS